MVLKRTEMFVFVVGLYACSPRIRLASRRSFGMMVTRLAWMAHKLASSNSLTRYASAASWRHSIAADWNRRSVLKSWAISLTNLWKGSFWMSSAEVFWKWQMSCRATVPALYLWGCVSPASSPRVSSSFAHPSSPVRSDPARFSPLCERCTGLAAFSRSGDNLWPSCVALYEPPLVLVVHFRPSFCAC